MTTSYEFDSIIIRDCEAKGVENVISDRPLTRGYFEKDLHELIKKLPSKKLIELLNRSPIYYKPDLAGSTVESVEELSDDLICQIFSKFRPDDDKTLIEKMIKTPSCSIRITKLYDGGRFHPAILTEHFPEHLLHILKHDPKYNTDIIMLNYLNVYSDEEIENITPEEQEHLFKYFDQFCSRHPNKFKDEMTSLRWNLYCNQ